MATDYQETLEHGLLPYISNDNNIGCIFQQDNAPIHTARSTITWLEERNIEILPWPALSPDLNPIENLWGILTRRVYKNGKQFNTLNELKNAILNEWDQISLEEVRNLIMSMPNRIFSVILNSGAKTKY